MKILVFLNLTRNNPRLSWEGACGGVCCSDVSNLMVEGAFCIISAGGESWTGVQSKWKGISCILITSTLQEIKTKSSSLVQGNSDDDDDNVNNNNNNNNNKRIYK